MSLLAHPERDPRETAAPKPPTTERTEQRRRLQGHGFSAPVARSGARGNVGPWSSRRLAADPRARRRGRQEVARGMISPAPAPPPVAGRATSSGRRAPPARSDALVPEDATRCAGRCPWRHEDSTRARSTRADGQLPTSKATARFSRLRTPPATNGPRQSGPRLRSAPGRPARSRWCKSTTVKE